MSLTDLQLVQQTFQGLFEAVCSSLANAGDMANAMLESEINWQKTADDASAAATTAEFVLQTVPRRALLRSAWFVPATATALTSNATNYSSIVFQSRNGAGGSALSLGTTNTTPTANGGTGNWSQWNTVNLTVTAFDPNNQVIPALGLLTASIAKGGAGVITPGGTLTARIQYI